MSEYEAAEYEYYQATRDGLEHIADMTDWREMHYVNHYSHAAFKAMQEEARNA